MISKKEIFSIQNSQEFEILALKIFQFQAENNLVYKNFIDCLNLNPEEIGSIEEIPFLPIQFFKSHEIITQNQKSEKVFTSSGTTGSVTSKHFVSDMSFYTESLKHSFRHFYGSMKDYTIFALLPSYLEREGSSLIDMVEFWISESGKGEFYLHNHEKLFQDLKDSEAKENRSILIGVSFALLDFIEKFQIDLKHTIVMETGGMKGRKNEITREELHQLLKKGFGVDEIHSEYGMTELLSQAYSQGNSKFYCPQWMKVLIRDTEDPLSYLPFGRTGGINIIDLANLNSCSFIATEDLGRNYADGSFEIMGRFDNTDVRGCNLMVSDI